MKFTKMNGCGNDYIYVDGLKEKIVEEKKPELARKLSDRHFGIGSDGLIFINPSAEADFEMEMYNADGSRGEMCGNGIRCVAKYVYDKGMTDKTNISVISAGQIKYLDLSIAEGKVMTIRVNMGKPILKASDIPVKYNYDNYDIDDIDKEIINKEIEIMGNKYNMTCVSMGNPHAVIFLEKEEDLQDENLMIETIGPAFENHPYFPKRINTEFVHVINRNKVSMRVWERGSGETLACGTGACAVAVACVLNGLTEERVTVKLLGGELEIYWDRKEDLIYMTGSAETVFEGEITLS